MISSIFLRILAYYFKLMLEMEWDRQEELTD